MANFEGKEKREASINECLKTYGIRWALTAGRLQVRGRTT